MGIPTLIETNSDSTDIASIEFTSGIDGTYDEYMFVITDLNAASGSQSIRVTASTDGGSSYGVTATSTFWRSIHTEDAASADIGYNSYLDLAQETGPQSLTQDLDTAADAAVSGIFTLYAPSNTTHVKHFVSRVGGNMSGAAAYDFFVGGYYNTTTAINAIKFAMSSGNFDGTIQMYGIA